MGKIPKYIFVSLALVVLQTTVMRLFSIELITPDILTIWIVYLALQSGQMRATVWGFGIGLLLDIMTGAFIGLSALSKTICGFFAGYFHNENKTQTILGTYRFLVIVALSSLIQNLVYFTVFTSGTDISFMEAFFRFSVTTSIYTGITALIPMFVFSRRLMMHYV